MSMLLPAHPQHLQDVCSDNGPSHLSATDRKVYSDWSFSFTWFRSISVPRLKSSLCDALWSSVSLCGKLEPCPVVWETGALSCCMRNSLGFALSGIQMCFVYKDQALESWSLGWWYIEVVREILRSGTQGKILFYFACICIWYMIMSLGPCAYVHMEARGWYLLSFLITACFIN